MSGVSVVVIHNKTGIILDNLENLSNVIEDLIKDQNKENVRKNAKYRAQSELDWKHQIETYISIINNFNH